MRFFSFLIGIGSFAFPLPVHAQIDIIVQPYTGLAGIRTGGAGSLFDLIAFDIPLALTTALFGILFAGVIYYGFRLLMGGEDEAAITEVKAGFGHALFGAVLVGSAGLIAASFSTSGQPVDVTPLQQTIVSVIGFFTGFVGTALIINIVIQGVRLITAQDDSQIDKAKKGLLYGMIGVVFVMLADPIVNSFAPSTAGATEVASQARGIAEFLITIFGALAVIAMIVGGLMLVVSVDEQLKDRGKKIIIGGIISIIVVIASFSIINLFLGEGGRGYDSRSL